MLIRTILLYTYMEATCNQSTKLKNLEVPILSNLMFIVE
jgi:hypothetical protein